MEEIVANKRLHAIAHGRVQGVNFRWFTRRRANELELTGWVRNLPGGRRVEVIAEGAEEQLQDLVRFLHTGPVGASVDDVEIEWQNGSGEFDRFSVRF
jgi:acylphosphatase